MIKDIFIDNNVAKNFTNPVNPEYLKLINWLKKYDKPPIDKPDHINAHLVFSKKIAHEYYASAQHAYTDTCMPVIIDQLTREGRLVKISNEQIKNFHTEYFKPKIIKRLKSNKKDWDHIPAVLLSNRKYALAIDDNFCNDLVNFPGFKTKVAKRPENLPYDK
jgi:hypothetical protein